MDAPAVAGHRRTVVASTALLEGADDIIRVIEGQMHGYEHLLRLEVRLAVIDKEVRVALANSDDPLTALLRRDLERGIDLESNGGEWIVIQTETEIF